MSFPRVVGLATGDLKNPDFIGSYGELVVTGDLTNPDVIGYYGELVVIRRLDSNVDIQMERYQQGVLWKFVHVCNLRSGAPW